MMSKSNALSSESATGQPNQVLVRSKSKIMQLSPVPTDRFRPLNQPKLQRQSTHAPMGNELPVKKSNQVLVRSKSRIVQVSPTPTDKYREPVPTKIKRRETRAVMGDNLVPPVQRLDIQTDASNNLCFEPTDKDIKKQLLQWKSEYDLKAGRQQQNMPKTRDKPKHNQAFYDLRKALVNRERVEVQQSSLIIEKIKTQEDSVVASRKKLPTTSKSTAKPIVSPSVPQSGKTDAPIKFTKETPTNESKPETPPGPKTKIYVEEPDFEMIINSEPHHGFTTFLETTGTETFCKSIVEELKVKESEKLNEIGKLLDKWSLDGFLKKIDDHVSKCSLDCASTKEIVDNIASPDAYNLFLILENDLHVQLAKAYAIYCYVAFNSKRNDHDFNDDYGLLDEDCVPSLDHAALFQDLAKAADLEVEIIHGEIRDWTTQKKAHTWNMVSFFSHLVRSVDVKTIFLTPFFTNLQVSVGGISIILDCTSGGNSHTSYYFGAAPQQLILTHLPTNPSHQLLLSPLSLEDVQAIIPIPVTTVKEGIVPLTWSNTLEAATESQCPVVSVQLRAPENCLLSAKLIPEPEIDLPDESFDQNVHLERSEDHWTIQAAASRKGNYKLNIFRKFFQKDNLSSEDESMCLSYNIKCETDSELKLGYPKLHEAAITTHQVNLLHWNSPTQSYICQNMSGLLAIVFEAKSNIKFDHYILPGRVGVKDINTAGNIKRFNTMLANNSKCLYQLQAVFPSNGWWTVCLTGALDSGMKTYTPLMTYYVYVTVGLPRSSYPHILSSDITCKNTKPITSEGGGKLKMQFLSSKHHTCHHHLTFDTPNNDQLDGYTKVDFEGKVDGKECYVYGLVAIFPEPGNWYIHVYSKENKSSNCSEHLFKMNVSVTGAMKNTSFISNNQSVGEIYGIDILNNGLFKFLDNGEPLNYVFKALRKVNFFHTLKSKDDEDSAYDYSTYLSSEASDDETESPTATYTLSAVFPSEGKWLVKLFASKEYTNYSLVLSLSVNVSHPSPQLCYPRIKPAFSQFDMKICGETALMKSTCEAEELEFPFQAPEGNFFTWNMELVSNGEKSHSNAFIHYVVDSETYNQLLHIIFPQPGEWLVRVFSKQMSDTQDKTSNFRPIFELRLKSLTYRSDASFPQIFEPFYSTFNLRIDRKDLPILSKVEQIPTKITIPIYGSSNIEFWHDIDIECEDENSENFNVEDQCKIISDDFAGKHKLIIEINAKGKWMVLLYAKKSTALGHNWISIMKCVVLTA